LDEARKVVPSYDKLIFSNDKDVAARLQAIEETCDDILTDAANIIRAFSITSRDFNVYDKNRGT
jgi:hypothetical protein